METLKKNFFCTILNKEIDVDFIINDVRNTNGTVKKKRVDFFNCHSKEECGSIYLRDCVCLREVRRVETEVNGL
jgi:hypothetical protein